jgi:DNA modification methylase
MLTKSEKYRYNHEAVKEPTEDGGTRNRRTVWHINTSNSGSSHIAAFPQALVEPCILASTEAGDFVLDPFFGSGTVGLVAQRLGRRYVGIELNPVYVADSIASLDAAPRAPTRNGSRHAKPDYEFAPTLLESPGDDGDSTGGIPAVSSAGAGADDQGTGVGDP